VQAIQADIVIASDLFDLSLLIARYPPAEPDGGSHLLPLDETRKINEDAFRIESAE